jgi:hypothetical protein
MLDDFNKSEPTSDIIKPGLNRRTAIGTLLLAGVSMYSSSAAADPVSVVRSLVQYFNQGAAGIPNYNALLNVNKLKVFSIHDGIETNGTTARDTLNTLMKKGAQFKLIGQPIAHGPVVGGQACWIDFDGTPNDTLAYSFIIENELLIHASTLPLAVGVCS